MNHKALIPLVILSNSLLTQPTFAQPTEQQQLHQEIIRLQQQTQTLQQQLTHLQKKLITHSEKYKHPVPTKKNLPKSPKVATKSKVKSSNTIQKKEFHNSAVIIHSVEYHPESLGFYPTALIADDRVITYIAGTPVVTSPYTGDRPAFDGSDYIVNISSINRDIRLMQQRRRLYNAYESIGYPAPNIPIIAISGKAEPVASLNRPYLKKNTGDVTLGSSELDVAAILNESVEAFLSISYDESPPALGGQRVTNSAFSLNLGFVNIGNLDRTPFYFTAGQLYAPYGRYSSSMVSSPLTLLLARTKTRPFILGYKSQTSTGPYAAVYGFTSETLKTNAAVGGANLGYIFGSSYFSGDIGAGFIGSLTDSQGMQNTGSPPFTTFGGFSSITNGSEFVKHIPGVDVHWNMSIDRYSFTAEWVGASKPFRVRDLSFNGQGAKPQALQLEAGVTFRAFDKPSSLGVGYQWTKEALALNLPKRRISGVFNISIWKDTVESLEYRHDTDYGINNYANGIAPPGLTNNNTLGTGHSSDMFIAQIGVYF